MNRSIPIETISYFNRPDLADPVPFNQQIINQYGIEGFILYLAVLFIVSTVGSYLIMKRMKEINEKEQENED